MRRIRFNVKIVVCAVSCLFGASLLGSGFALDAGSRWTPLADGTGIEWLVVADRRLPHTDKIEMSGQGVSLILEYGVGRDGALTIKRQLVWPSLRIIPNDTYGQYVRTFDPVAVPCLLVDGRCLVEHPRRFVFDGVLTIESDVDGKIEVTRRIFPAVEKKASIEIVTIRNAGNEERHLTVNAPTNIEYRLGCTGRYCSAAEIAPAMPVRLASGESKTFSFCFAARRMDEPAFSIDGSKELLARRKRVAELVESVVLETGDPVLDLAFRLAKIRAGESIFRTRGGLLHSPGGGSYYAATWCNDQIEYAGPWFAMTGDPIAQEASLNAYLHYVPFMAPDYAPIPSSVIAEGNDIWNGAGDRGDAAMWAYGATRFVLAMGRRDWAERLLPGIRWTLEYCHRKLNTQGVVTSDTDELEGRLPSGKANLCTSSLYYDALRHAAYLERDLGNAELSSDYTRRASEIHKAIDGYFGAELHGWRTYRYYEDCKVLRSWIGIPLCMGITERTADTVSALFSKYLWTGDGMLSAEGDGKGITWDRSALYAFRGVLSCGQGEKVLDELRGYSVSRLLGEHVPYPVEAWPEGDKRHLAAESALYCRIFTEGLFGIDPVGLGEFDVKGRVPSRLRSARLRRILLQGECFDLFVLQDGTVGVSRVRGSVKAK